MKHLCPNQKKETTPMLYISGPLTWADPITSKIKLIGVASWSTGCGKRGKPGVYAKVATALGWVKQTVGSCWFLNMMSCSGLLYFT